MNNVTKLALVLSLATAPAVFASKAPEWLKSTGKAMDLRTIKDEYTAGNYGQVAIKGGVVAVATAAVGTTLWALNKHVPAFNKHVTQNVKAVAKGYVARMRQLDVPTVGLTLAVLGLAAAGYKIHCKNAQLEAAKAVPSRDGYFADLANVEFAGKKFAAQEKALADAKKDVTDNKDTARKDALDKAVTDAEKALADAQKAAKDASHAAAFAQLLAGANPAKVDDVIRINNAVLETLADQDALAAYNRK